MEKFDGNNFHTWKVKFQMHLMNRGLWSIVKGTNKHLVIQDFLLNDKRRKKRLKLLLVWLFQICNCI
jgi:hypothetical protein